MRFWRTTESTHEYLYRLYRIADGVDSPLDETFSLLTLEGTINHNDFDGAGADWFGDVAQGNSNVYSRF